MRKLSRSLWLAVPIILILAVPAYAQTPTPPAIQLPSGQVASVDYSLSFGEIIITGMLLILNVQLAARAVYDVIYQIWNKRRTVILEQ